MLEVDYWRLFIALPISESIRREMEGTQNELRKALPNHSVRWTKPEQFHLTLKFLGDVSADRVDALVQSVATAYSGFTPLALKAEGLGCFPNDRRPRVIWIGVRDDLRRLQSLQAAISAATVEFGSAEVEKNFKGHMTIGRIKEIDARARKILSRLIDEKSEMKFGEWLANEVKIIRSELSDSGATHKDVTAIHLKNT